MEIVGACKYVDKVVESCKEDSEAWFLHKFDKLFVGSDYKGSERFKNYEQFFADKNVEIIYFPYTKGTSSTQIRDCITKKNI
jgi:glycerol-3-phosphate cytidylyltransferase-like family protein